MFSNEILLVILVNHTNITTIQKVNFLKNYF